MESASTPKVETFVAPTQLPRDEEQNSAWQAQNRAWWEANPMQYAWHDRIPGEPGTAAYYDEVDRRFFESAKVYLPWKKVPFDTLVDFDALRTKDVLEIGVGCGTHAELLARHAKTYTGVDLTEFASSTTRQRLAVRGLP